ncbi:MAG TPA: chorismate-binding protein, partial [Tepidisphaeraceae bacterium]|nr:chorismate-binding protein [Tepidisphaeraceae bacterium]
MRSWTDPLHALQWMEEHIRQAPAEHRWIGYLSYDLGGLFEDLPAIALDDLGLPLFEFGLVAGGTGVPPVRGAQHGRDARATGIRSTFSRESYLAAVSRAIEYIRAGDIFQVNLSQRFTASSHEPPHLIYERLLETAPAWYGGMLDFGDYSLVCNSPELFLRVEPDAATGECRIITRPIKGTRPRKAGMEA